MAVTPPKPHLPPETGRWGDWVEKMILDLRKKVDRASMDVVATKQQQANVFPTIVTAQESQQRVTVLESEAEARAKLDPMNLLDMTPVLLQDATLWRATKRNWSVDGSGNPVYTAAVDTDPNITAWFNDGFTITATSANEEVTILNPENFTYNAQINADPKMTLAGGGALPWGSKTAAEFWNGTQVEVTGQMYAEDGTALGIAQNNGVRAREPIELPEEWALYGGGNAGSTMVRSNGITSGGVTLNTATWTPSVTFRFRSAGESITVRNFYVRATDPINWSATTIPAESVDGFTDVQNEQSVLTAKSATDATNLFDVTPLVLQDDAGFVVEYQAVLVEGTWRWQRVAVPTFTITAWYTDGFDISVPPGRSVLIGNPRPIPNTSPVYVTGQMRITSVLPTGAVVGLGQQAFDVNGAEITSDSVPGETLYTGVWVTGNGSVPGAVQNVTPGLAVSKSGTNDDAPPFVSRAVASWTPALTILPADHTDTTTTLNVAVRDIRMTAAPIPAPHVHIVQDVTGLVGALADKSNVGHAHVGADVAAATDTARGTVELATTAEAAAGTDTTRAVTPAGLAAWGAKLTRAVFVGSSNVTNAATSWPAKLCAIRGWTMHNYAIGGSGFFTSPSTDRFRAQVDSAVAGMTTQQRAEVGHFFVADASNDARSNTAYASIKTEADAIYASIRANFPNAKIVALPVIWPADTQKYTPAIWTYDPKWNGSALAAAEAQRRALEAYPNALFVEQSWTWLTGRDELMLALQDVHPNAAGHDLIARYMDRALNGEIVVPETGWVEIPAPSGYTNGHRGRPLSVKRRGWTVQIEGSSLKSTAFSGFAEYGIIPYGYRPTFETVLTSAGSDTGGINGLNLALHVYPSGNIRRYETTGRLGVLINDSFEMG